MERGSKVDEIAERIDDIADSIVGEKARSITIEALLSLN
jgi:hypothetical protein